MKQIVMLPWGILQEFSILQESTTEKLSRLEIVPLDLTEGKLFSSESWLKYSWEALQTLYFQSPETLLLSQYSVLLQLWHISNWVHLSEVWVSLKRIAVYDVWGKGVKRQGNNYKWSPNWDTDSYLLPTTPKAIFTNLIQLLFYLQFTAPFLNFQFWKREGNQKVITVPFQCNILIQWD